MKNKHKKRKWLAHIDSKYKNPDNYITIHKVVIRNNLGSEIIKVIPAKKQLLKRKVRKMRIQYSSFTRA